MAHPAFKHGRNSRYHLLPGQLRDAYESARNDPHLLELTEHIALVDAKLKTLVRDMAAVWHTAGGDSPDPRPDWLRLRDGWETLNAARSTAEKHLAIERFGALINAGAQSARLTGEYVAMTETLRRLVETQTRRDEKLGQFVPAEHVRALVRGFVESAKRHIPDPATLMSFQQDIADLFRHSGPPRGVTAASSHDLDRRHRELP